MPRVFFIPGFGESELVFSKIAPELPGDHTFVDVWSLLGDQPRPTTTVPDFARELIDQYALTPDDLLIGHSMGGWIAYHIKQCVGCPIVQIASWTEADRVAFPLKNLAVVAPLVRAGVVFTPLYKWMTVQLEYKKKPSRSIFEDAFDRLINSPKEAVVNQLRLILTPVKPLKPVVPDLRIHARADTIIKPPKEPFHEVPGDHFTLFTHPETVVAPIRALLAKAEHRQVD
ncbi:alpha/beta fold hydrolase [Tellurirhabdus rosea]|uniref:alpha/beta fold hydrolase n=1 Tax=Tellurirhabdus rosea TaxID=2674997 RepID=UPI002256AB59|nr:alpha/beta hydrolase [Tellurirhabdus rosea]